MKRKILAEKLQISPFSYVSYFTYFQYLFSDADWQIVRPTFAAPSGIQLSGKFVLPVYPKQILPISHKTSNASYPNDLLLRFTDSCSIIVDILFPVLISFLSKCDNVAPCFGDKKYSLTGKHCHIKAHSNKNISDHNYQISEIQ